MNTFILIGEGYYALQVCEIIHLSSQASLLNIITSKNDRILTNWANENQIRIINQDNLNNYTDYNTNADWLISVNSSKIISSDTLNLFKNGGLNLHNGPLPKYAGLHVHQWGIRHGKLEFGSTIHYIDAGIDTGDIVSECSFPILENDTGLTLYRRSFAKGVELIIEVLNKIFNGEKLIPKIQDLSQREYYSHSSALDGRINWNWTMRQIVDFVRAGNYYPLKSPTYIAFLEPIIIGKIEILCAEPYKGIVTNPGTINLSSDGNPEISCSDGSVRLIDSRLDGVIMDNNDWAKFIFNLSGNQLISRSENYKES